MKKDKEPEQLASIALSREEIASRQRVMGKPRMPVSTGQAGAPKLLWVLLIFSLIFCGVLAVQFYQLKQQSDIQIEALAILQDKLTSTDEQANLSVDAMKILLREQDHEIRKLWDLSNKRNKVDIRKNKDKLDDQSKLITKQAGKIDLLDKEISKIEKDVTKKVTAKIDLISKNMEQVKANTLLLESKVDKSLNDMPKNLSKTLSDHEKGIKAMDATRLQLMRRIQDLEKEIEKLNKTTTSSPSPAQP